MTKLLRTKTLQLLSSQFLASILSAHFICLPYQVRFALSVPPRSKKPEGALASGAMLRVLQSKVQVAIKTGEISALLWKVRNFIFVSLDVQKWLQKKATSD